MTHLQAKYAHARIEYELTLKKSRGNIGASMRSTIAGTNLAKEQLITVKQIAWDGRETVPTDSSSPPKSSKFAWWYIIFHGFADNDKQNFFG